MSSNGKLLVNKNHDIFTANLKAIPKKDLIDGTVVSYGEKEVGRSDIYPQSVKHSPNGVNFMVGDGEEFVIYRSTGFKNVRRNGFTRFRGCQQVRVEQR